jgi:HAMP domain-containing protein
LGAQHPEKDYYAVLGAREDASQTDIDRLYKREAHRRHPDLGGTEEEMKALNEAYEMLRNEEKRKAYDTKRARPAMRPPTIRTTPSAREIGWYGQSFNALLCLILGLMLLFLVRFNGLFFLWPLAILAVSVIGFGVLIAHAAITNARDSLAASHPARRFRVAQEITFWMIICGAGYVVYLVLTEI